MTENVILCGDWIEVLRSLPDQTFNTCITSPPYFGLRNYLVDGQLGLESTPAEYVEKLVLGFREVRRTLRDDGTLWIILGDSYSAGGRGANEKHSQKMGTGTATAQAIGSKRVPGYTPKNLIGIPWLVAFALQADGWILRQDIVWSKGSPMPEPVKDRCVKSHEYIFLLAKSQRYYFDYKAIQEPAKTKEERPFGIVRDREYEYDSKLKVTPRPHKNLQDKGQRPQTMHLNRVRTRANGLHQEEAKRTGSSGHCGTHEMRNKRSVWNINTTPYKGAHFAVFPEKLIIPCVLAGCPVGGIVLDPFMGSGTTALVAKQLGRKYLGIELNPDYVKIAEDRLRQEEMF